MYCVLSKYRRKQFPSLIEGLDMDAMSECVDQPLRPPNSDSDVVFTPKARGYVKGLMNTLSLAKFHSGCNVSEKSFATLKCKTDVGEVTNKLMLKMGGCQKDESEGEVEAKTKINSLISIMVSTIMCLAAGYPVPKSNIQVTKTFLSTIVSDSGETPMNVKRLAALLKKYTGPYEGGASKQSEHCANPFPEPADIASPDLSLKNLGQSSPERTKKAVARMKSRLPSLSTVKKFSEHKKLECI